MPTIIRLDDALLALRAIGACVADDELTPLERGLADAAPSEKRRQEIRAGRAAARAALTAFDPQLRLVSVLAEVDGRPRLEPPGGGHVSLAHDGVLAIAAFSLAPVGVDLLALDRTEQARRVVEQRIATGRARALEPGPRPWDEAVLLWTAWEALGKHSGGGVLAGAMRAQIAPTTGEQLTADVNGVRLRWLAAEGSLVCLATGAR